MISKTSTRLVWGETYGKVLIAWCDDLWSVGPWQYTLMSLCIRYAHIPFYFCFSFTSSTLLIHHYALQPHTITLTLASLDRSRLFDGHMIYDSHVFTCILSISNVRPPTVQPITSPHTAWSGTFYNFTLDEPYAHFLVYHSYLTCLYFTFCSDHHQRRATQLPIWVSPRIEI